MDIAATGLALPLLNPVRERVQTRRDPGPQSGNRTNTDSARTSTAAGTERRNEREVRGEVIYERPERDRVVDAAKSSAGSAASAFTSASPRRFSIPAAIQAFRDNQALVTQPGQSRQVSGIIDEYV